MSKKNKDKPKSNIEKFKERYEAYLRPPARSGFNDPIDSCLGIGFAVLGALAVFFALMAAIYN